MEALILAGLKMGCLMDMGIKMIEMGSFKGRDGIIMEKLLTNIQTRNTISRFVLTMF